ncbi:chloride channel protein [Capilliphycus salinus ALCB114379]|uniref:chloride channel protein n=1 Tax=Capilliphycus salinus TaxID=2768948 RepID=UPI0039A6D12C
MLRISIPEQLSKQFKIIAAQILQPQSPRRFAIIEACLIGVVSGLAAFFLREGAGWLGSLRVYGSLNAPVPIWVFLPGVGLIGGFLTGFLVERFAPETTGSGVPQVKAALSGMPISLDFRVAVSKLLGTMFTMGSGFTLGRQGPTVQIGAALAGWIGRWVPTSPNYSRQIIACGAAAGLAAGFNAPIAGVLFVVEDLLHDVSGITLGPAIIASFIGAVVSRLLEGQNPDFEPPSPELLELSYQQWLIEPGEIPFYIILGILAGILGTLFSRGIVSSLKFSRKTFPLGLPVRMALAGFLCGLIVSVLPIQFRNNAGLREFLLSGELNLKITALAFIAHFVLTTIAASSSAPGGLFAPSLVLGAALGKLIGIWEYSLFHLESPTTYAYAGMGAFFCAVSRTPITAVVIVFEITRDFNLVLQLMICSVVAYFVADKVDKRSLYDRLLKLNGIELKDDQLDREALSKLLARDVMQPSVESLSSQLTLLDVRQEFSRSQHRGFPVVENGKLVGIVTQRDLSNASQQSLPEDTPLYKFMTPKPITVKPDDTLTQVLYLLGKYKPSRLPVVEGRHLVGIITRSDIIKAELGVLSGEDRQVGLHPEPSYVVYQTRAPQVGKGRMLVSLYNPQTASSLLEIAAAIARERNYEIECLNVITIPRHRSPSETPVKLTKSRRLMRQAEQMGRAWKIPLHTQVRVTNDVAQAILETAKERHIDLILMGWQGKSSTSDRIFGNVVDVIIRACSCEVVLVKWPHMVDPFNTKRKLRLHSLLGWQRWLVPIRDDANKSVAVQLLPALTNLSHQPEIRLLKVMNKSISVSEKRAWEQTSQELSSLLNSRVRMTAVTSEFVPEAVIDFAYREHCDVVVLGASREGMLKQVIQGNIPEAIARYCDCTVILVRPAMGHSAE